jgi:L-amino acid N-acyltransferase YncA
MNIRQLNHNDANDVLEIYQQGINTGIATFYTDIPTWETFDKKFLKQCRLVVEEEGKILGWAVLSSVSIREFYNGVGEVTIYIHEDARGKGVGKFLLNALIEESEKNGFWSLLSVIHDDNTVSIHLHEVCGFRIIGYRERIAQIHGKWKNTIMMERRSKKVGVQ